MTAPHFPIPPFNEDPPGSTSANDKIIIRDYLNRKVLPAVNDLAARVAALEAASVPVPVPEPEPIPEPIPEPTPTPEPTPPPPPAGSAELPRVTPSYAGPVASRVITVSAGGDLQAALNTARGTDNVVIQLEAGAEFRGHYEVATSGDGWLLIKGMTVTPGTRIRPSLASSIPKLVSTSTDPTLRVTGRKVWMEGFEVAVGTAVSALTYNIVQLEPGAADLVLAGLYVHGQPRSEVQRGIALNSGATVIRDCWISDCHAHGFEGHGIGGWSATGPQLLENNYIEAAGINVMIGGATPSTVGLRTADVTIRRNHLIKPLAWKGDWTAKNLLETKNVNRILVEENVFENSWTDAQTGIGVLFKSSNDQGTCNWCQSTDITMRRNLVKGAETGLVVNAAENYCKGAPDSEVGPSKWCQVRGEIPPATARVSIYDNLFDDLGAAGNGAKGVYIGPVHSPTGVVDLLLERNVTAQGAGKQISHGLMLLSPGAQRAVFRNNVLAHGYFAVISNQGDNSLFGDAALQAGAPGAVWEGMAFVKSPNHEGGTAPPAGSTVVTAEPALAAQIRSVVNAAVQGVVVAP